MKKLFRQKQTRLYEKVALMVLGVLLVFGQGPTISYAIEIVITDNGSGSSNEVSTQVETTTTVEQTNESNISNEVVTEANTGGNEASGNTGGDVNLTTGDVNQNLSVENSVNRSVVETECCGQDATVTISGNGAGSENSGLLALNSNTGIYIEQRTDIKNKIEGVANTGENSANSNTNGNISIGTGNIYAKGGIENGPINIHSVRVPSGGGDYSLKIVENASSSINEIAAWFDNDNYVFVNNEADIDNFVNWDLNTGRNYANGNTGGDVNIETGDIFFDFFIKNGPINIGAVEIPCCDIFDPDNPPDDNDNPPPGGGPSDPGSSNNPGSSQGTLLSSAAATEAGGPGLVGLSDTGSDLAQAIFFWAGILMIVYGSRLIGREASGKISS
jgi:hypothetical protein